MILGDTSVGKTSIINRFLYDFYNEKSSTTIGIDFISKTFNTKDKSIKF